MERRYQSQPPSEWPDDEDILIGFYGNGTLLDDANYDNFLEVTPEQLLLPPTEPPPFPPPVDNFAFDLPDEVPQLDFPPSSGLGLSDMGSISPGTSDATDFTGSLSDIFNFTGSPGSYEGGFFTPTVPAFQLPISPVFLYIAPMQVPLTQQATIPPMVSPLLTPFYQQETGLPLPSFSSTQETTQPSESPSQTDAHQPSETHQQNETRPVLSAYDPSFPTLQLMTILTNHHPCL